MKKSEASEALAFCAAFDQRTLGHADAEGWALALADVPWDDTARQAIAEFYGADGPSPERRFIQPHNVRAGRARIRNDRLARIVEPPPNVVEGVTSPEELRALRKAIADGAIPDQDAAARYSRWGGSLHLAQLRGAVPSFAAGPVPAVSARPVGELLAGAFRTVPPPGPEDTE